MCNKCLSPQRLTGRGRRMEVEFLLARGHRSYFLKHIHFILLLLCVCLLCLHECLCTMSVQGLQKQNRAPDTQGM